nr:immunoglobulin light chain junction region [Macaca mulatta]MOW39398.1 immunoglobulin light chain junction region [Macaca mulatta]MOW39687.1 immunoglobulin light chain junction region [Macaca mulatta]MOW39786.1 immunoglobulin light chain junction region [Macaca mulatta]MOW40167.1 immunoglobulin light chain junction region [Macaca mulatta]
CQQGSSYPWTF